MATMTFARTEKKYMLNMEKYIKLLGIIKKHMKPDEYGEYTICNVYYDTDSYELIRRSCDKPSYKEKLRIRSYGTPDDDDDVFLELKKKCLGTVYKRRIILSAKSAVEFAEYGIMPDNCGQITNEIDYFLKHYNPEARVYIAYDREAYRGSNDCPGLRVTFDSNIRYRMYNLDLRAGDSDCLPLIDDDYRLMEIKGEAALPLWLCAALSQYEITPCHFSKYGSVYKKMLEENYKYKEEELCSGVYCNLQRR